MLKLMGVMLVSITTSLFSGNAYGIPCAGEASVPVKVKGTTTYQLQDYDISKVVSTATGCMVSDASQDHVGDKLADHTVNLGTGFFGINQWNFDGKAMEAGELPELVSFTQSFTQKDNKNEWTGGSFTFNQKAAQYTNIMFVFKSNDNLVAYLLGAGANGSYGNPFTKPPFIFNPDFQAISHISVYYNGEEGEGGQTEVPEPASMALLGLGALGLVSLRRRQATAR